MKIKTLHIKGHKNLEDARFKHTGDLIAIIGNNGCGKSNLLEAISCIFKNLYKNERNIPFDFYLEYVTSDNKKVEIEKDKSKLSFRVDSITHVGISDFLPKKVVAIYSGEEDRLWKQYYRPFYLDYISNINRERHASLPQMLYLNKFYWNIALLCLSLSENNREFLEQVLGITKIEKIKFEFTKSNYDDFKNNPALHLVKTLDYQTEHTFKDLSELLDLLYSVDEIFSYLYIAFTPDKKKIINDITVMFNDGLTIEDLSEGQKKLLLLKSALEFAGQEDTLYLLDEPDAHVHVNNKDKVIEALKPYIHNRQVIVTTHSPTITQCVDDKNLFMMNSGSFIPKNKQTIIDEITGEFWNAHQQNSFLASKKDVILVEGKTDVMHIETALSKLQEKYPVYKNLKFAYLPFGGASGLKLFVEEYPVKEIKTIFAFVDKDQAGHDAIKETLEISNTQDFQGAVKNNIHIYFIPIKSGHTQKNFMIEDYYSLDIYKAFYLKDITCANEFPNPSKSNFKLAFAKYCKDLEIEDFEDFRILFDLILEIKGNNQIQPNVSPTQKVATNNVTSQKKSSVSDHHIEYWKALVKKSQNKQISYNFRSPRSRHWMDISIGKSIYYIRITNDTRNSKIGVQFICIGKDALGNFNKLRGLYEKDSKLKIDKNVEWVEKDKAKEQQVNLFKTNINPLNKEDWVNQHLWFVETIEKFHYYFKDKIQKIQ